MLQFGQAWFNYYSTKLWSCDRWTNILSRHLWYGTLKIIDCQIHIVKNSIFYPVISIFFRYDYDKYEVETHALVTTTMQPTTITFISSICYLRINNLLVVVPMAFMYSIHWFKKILSLSNVVLYNIIIGTLCAIISLTKHYYDVRRRDVFGNTTR